MAKAPTKTTPPLEGAHEGFRSAVGAVMRADRAAGGLIRNAAHGAARLAAKHPEAAVGAIGGAIIGHKLAKGVDKTLPQGQHLTRRAKARWAASGAVAGGLAGAALSHLEQVEPEAALQEDSYYVGYHLQGMSPNKAKVFRSPTLLNGYTHRKFGHVEGPFASRQDAEDLVHESLIRLFNEEVDRINEATSDKFTSYVQGDHLSYPHLAQAIKRARGGLRGNGSGNVLAADITAKTARGEEPIGYVDGDGFHYKRPELKKKRLPEMKNLDEGITFVSRPMSFQARVKEKLKEAELNEKEFWMQDVHPKKGALHKQLNIPQGQTISTSALRGAAKKGGLLAKRAQLALRYRGQ